VVLDWNTPPLNAALAAVPLPAEAKAAPGTDGHLVVYQPSTDQMWEFWHMREGLPGQWHAGWGGRIAAVSSDPGYYRLVHSPGGSVVEEPTWGATASSLPIADGMITLGDLQQGHIDHALQLLVPAARAGVHSFPAQRADGGETGSASVPEGAHFLLAASVDCARQRTPFMRMVCVAAQRYGLIVNDRTGGGLALRGEDPAPLLQAGRPNPYPAYFTDDVGKQWLPYQMMAAFPWSSLHLLPMRLE
jgi:hypothetical protein